MLKDRNIIYFSNDWNSDHRVSSHHIAGELMEHNRMLYVETGGMRKPRRSGRDIKRIVARLFSWFKGVRKINDNFYIYSLIVFPFHSKWARTLNVNLNVFVLRRAMRKHKFTSSILWFVTPHVSYLADHLEKARTIYYCTDNVSRMPGVDRDAIERLEDSLLGKADMVFATSIQSCDRLKEKNTAKNLFYSPQAVDVEHFYKVQSVDLPVARELEGLNKPVIGYIGLIEEWIDLDLIEHIARSRPDWSVVLIGRAAVPVDSITGLPNVRCLGIRKYQDLPFYLKGFDVCISPFKINELTVGVNPIKLKEYLASGKPVVTTRLPEMERFKGLVEIADSYDEFVDRIDFLCENDDAGSIERRMGSVKTDSWHNRVRKISETIENMERGNYVDQSY